MAIELTTATVAELSGINQALSSQTLLNVFPKALFRFNNSGFVLDGQNQGNTVNCLPLFNCRTIDLNGTLSLTTILNANVLTNLEDVGTTVALKISSCSFSAETLNQLFTDLPSTNKTATIDAQANPGTATCDTSIATDKGYTVVTE
jgi:hypothetical protein